VDERIGVDNLDCCGEARCVTHTAGGAIGGEEEHATQTLSSTLDRVSNRLCDKRRHATEPVPGKLC